MGVQKPFSDPVHHARSCHPPSQIIAADILAADNTIINHIIHVLFESDSLNYQIQFLKVLSIDTGYITSVNDTVLPTLHHQWGIKNIPQSKTLDFTAAGKYVASLKNISRKKYIRVSYLTGMEP